MTHLGRLASPGGGGVAMEVGAEGAEEAHGVHGPAANLCVRSGGHPIRGSGQEPLGAVMGRIGHSWGKLWHRAHTTEESCNTGYFLSKVGSLTRALSLFLEVSFLSDWGLLEPSGGPSPLDTPKVLFFHS